MGVFQNNLMGAAAAAASAGGDFYSYQIANSARFDGSASYLNKTWGSAPSSTTQVALSVWLKKSFTGNVNPVAIFTAIGNTGSFYFNNDDAIADNLAYYMGGGGVNGYTTNIRYRDPSAWFHFVAIINSAASNDYDRLKIYINGELIALNGGEWTQNAGYPNSNTPDAGKNGVANYIGRYGSATRYWDGYMADFIQIDGAAAISDFGETKNGVWIPKDPSGLTFGNNGFHLDFASSSDMGNDVSGNNNDWTANSISAHDQMIDTPTFNSDNGGNFATYDPLSNGSYSNLSEGNLKVAGNTSADACWTNGNFGMLSGKWYWEHKIGNQYAYGPTFGLALNGTKKLSTTTGQFYAITWQSSSSQMYAPSNSTTDFGMGTVTLNNTGVTNTSTDDYTSFYLDCDNRKLWIALNGTIPNSGDPANGTNPQVSWTETPLFPFMFGVQTLASPQAIAHLNTGSNPSFNGEDGSPGTETDDNGYGLFKYAPPTGFLALCQANLVLGDAINPSETSDDYPQKTFGAKTYTGTGSSNSITGLGFKPDWVWIKKRNGTTNHSLFDSSRGTTKYMASNSSGDEGTDSATLNAFGSDGFTVVSDTKVNASSDTYISWNWRANGGTTSTNTSGSVNSTVQTDPSGAFSIVTWAGSGGAATIGHGLSGKPSFMVAKSRTSGATVMDWIVFHQNMNDGSYPVNNSRMYWNSTGGYSTGSLWANDNNTASVFGVESNISNSSKDYVAYCFTDVEGYCKASFYIGNGDTNGTFVYLGFRPAWIMIKGLASGAGWNLHDNATSPNNVASTALQANTTGTELSNYNIDMLSNGFKIRDSDGDLGTNNNKYIYLAMAKNPFKYATAR
jgi:hypothetical protein